MRIVKGVSKQYSISEVNEIDEINNIMAN